MVRSISPRRRVVITVVSDGDLGRAVGFLLRAEGYEVETLDSGEALLASAHERASCLVIDQDLPGVSGIDTLRLLQDGLRTSSVLLVDRSDRSVRAEAERLGAELIEKPFHGALLLTAVRSAFKR